jgi:hypothetical protein
MYNGWINRAGKGQSYMEETNLAQLKWKKKVYLESNIKNASSYCIQLNLHDRKMLTDLCYSIAECVDVTE